ncbi:MAG: DUF4172 domain-containing protein [Planctomycetes bacterium]|nr:DUF4172 domain-containing protein [Planctomycetota bacterium]
MTWNWLHKDEPPYRWDASALSRAEWLFLTEASVAMGVAMHLPPRDLRDLAVDAIVRETVASANLENREIDEAAVRSAARQSTGLPGREAGAPAFLAIAVYRHAGQAISSRRILAWQRLVSRFSYAPPKGRPVFGARPRPRPTPIDSHQNLMGFVRWFSGGRVRYADRPLTRAGLAYRWFQSLQPFKDANEPLALALAESALMQATDLPLLTPLSPPMEACRAEYREQLDQARPDGDVTAWLVWFAARSIEAGRQNASRLTFIIEKNRLLQSLQGRLNGRQFAALDQLYRLGGEPLPPTFDTQYYCRLAAVDSATAAADLAKLTALQALVKSGTTPAYRLAVSLPAVARVRPEDLD